MEKIIKSIGVLLVVIAIGMFIIAIVDRPHEKTTYINGHQIITSDPTLIDGKSQVILTDQNREMNFIIPAAILVLMVGLGMIFYAVIKQIKKEKELREWFTRLMRKGRQK